MLQDYGKCLIYPKQQLNSISFAVLLTLFFLIKNLNVFLFLLLNYMDLHLIMGAANF